MTLTIRGKNIPTLRKSRENLSACQLHMPADLTYFLTATSESPLTLKSIYRRLRCGVKSKNSNNKKNTLLCHRRWFRSGPVWRRSAAEFRRSAGGTRTFMWQPEPEPPRTWPRLQVRPVNSSLPSAFTTRRRERGGDLCGRREEGRQKERRVNTLFPERVRSAVCVLQVNVSVCAAS